MTLRENLQGFVAWAKAYVRGDEKGEAQIFLDRLFEALGHDGGCRAAGGALEERVKPGKGAAVAFADYVWRPVVLIEMKRRGTPLKRHYQQAFDYWVRLVPNRPRYVILCNFDEFWIYDFETQVDDPIDRLALADLPARPGPLLFLLPEPEAPVFGNDQEAVTREAADLLAACFRSLRPRVGQPLAQRFTLQMLVALFAEDIGLLEQYFVTRLLEDCKRPADSYDLLGNLFASMNEPGRTAGGRYKGVDYFNGGLFSEAARVELNADELDLLRNAASKQWSQVRPEIFGTIFEHSLEKDARHAFGAHYTNTIDILKIVRPTIVEPWRTAIEGSGTQRELKALLGRLSHFTVLDPACGSGNFLYVAYREIKRLEARIYERLREMTTDEKRERQQGLALVTARNFFGMDVNPFAIELAKVTMSIARKLAMDELHGTENALPLDNLDANLVVADALVTDGKPTPWPAADVVIGNPPFLGAKRLKPERGVDYVNVLRDVYPEVPGMADYCVYWIRRTHDHLQPLTAADPFSGRAGLVGTQNIRNNQSRVGGLDHVVGSGTIVEAVDNQPWSGEANVHVSIVNWVKTQEPKLIPPQRLWTKAPTAKTKRGRGAVPAHKTVELEARDVAAISSALSSEVDVSGAEVLVCNTEPQRVFQGITPGHPGFVLSPDEAEALLRKDPGSRPVIHPYLIGRELVTGDGRPERFVIDFEQRTVLQCQVFPEAFVRVRDRVLPARQRKAEEGKDKDGNLRPHHKAFLDRWWRLTWGRAEMLQAFKGLRGRFIACSRVTKRPIFVFVDTDVRPADALQTFIFDDDYSFGILQSGIHWAWFIAKCAKLKSDFTYTPTSVFDTFPWPQSPSEKAVFAVAEAGREIRRLRAEALQHVRGGGLREVYRVLEAPGRDPLKDAHAALDAAVREAYGFPEDSDYLGSLLGLNRVVARRIDEGHKVQAPGIPAEFPQPGHLLSDDRIAL